MNGPKAQQSNFAQLKSYDEQLTRLGMLAERYFPEDPNTAMLKTRQLAELLAQHVATRVGVFRNADEPQYELIRRLQDEGIFTSEIAQLFTEVRRTGNAANHAMAADHETALRTLKVAWQLGVWFHRTFGNAGFKSGPFIPPSAPADESVDLRAELAELSRRLAEHRALHIQTSEQLETAAGQIRNAKSEQAFWEEIAEQSERAKADLAQQLADEQARSINATQERIASFIAAARNAADAIDLDEAETRLIIDQQLRQAGWLADSVSLRWSKGARPAKGINQAIAEWPTDNGPADYVLFAGLMPMATVEAKRENKDVSSFLQQAKRYSRGFKPSPDTTLHPENWGDEGEFRVPFVFSTNGRPYLRQIATKSGIWFCDVRRPANLGRPLEGWHTPEGLTAMLATDERHADELLKTEPFTYGVSLRPYQIDAITAVEDAIANGQRDMLLAMATGTGKTKTCVALVYRLLKTKRFRRVLFLVDRTPLGKQASDAFDDTRMENLQAFSEVFNVKRIDEQASEEDTAVHIATIQGMVQRTLADPDDAPPVDQYDCIIVDERHRGYLLDRDLSETELSFRGHDDYISKYRRVLDYFDAYKIGLTATPALHTTEIFGPPIFNYSYREAVIDGYLVDHEPPVEIKTELSTGGIVFTVGEEVLVWDPENRQMELFFTPDEIKLEIEEFNRKVITEAFNRVVCTYLAGELDPSSREKTLIFCATDSHADMVVDLLKQAFQEQYGQVDDDAVVKITGAADSPMKLFLRYKNERTPNVAVTVDLLTTGIDVPEICNLVFLRRVNSRILYDQMIGRATRLCPEIGKEVFRIFDAVQLYAALKDVTAMQPVVANPNLSVTQLLGELAAAVRDDVRSVIRDQLVAKLQRKKRSLTEEAAADFETIVGMSVDALIMHIRQTPTAELNAWGANNVEIGSLLDLPRQGRSTPTFVSTHPDRLAEVTHGYGPGQRPQDYLDAFAAFIKSHRDDIPALVTVLTRPRDLTRKQLRELALTLDRAGFSETSLTTAWREMTNQDIAARIVGFIRNAADAEPLVPHEQLVDRALQRMLSSRSWTSPQRQWLQKIAAQTKANMLVDRDALNDPDLIFKRDGGGFTRLDKMFNGELGSVLDQFNDYLWERAA